MEKNVNRPNKGMMQDVNPIDQPKESYRYALNAVNETNVGERNILSNEKSNEECYSLPEGHYPIGKVYTKDAEVVIFSINGGVSGVSEIGLVRNCTYTTIVNSVCLGFSIEYQIDATYRLRRGCETVIYFTDGLNSVRQINFAKLEDYYSDAYIAYLNSPIPLPPFTGEKWNCTKFNLIQDFKVPCFSEGQIINGGSIAAGSYNFAIQLLNEDGNATNWIVTSRPINIYHDNTFAPYNNINGSSQLEYDGLAGVPNNTSKSIQLIISNLDVNFSYYRIAVIQATQFTGIVNKTIVSPDIPITQETFIFDGGLNGYTEISVEEIKPGKIDIEVAKHIEQLENKLLLANTKGKQVNFCSFQQYASKIHSRYIVKEVGDTDISETGNPKNPLSPFEVIGFMGGEVYAMGIVYVFADGFESPVYHIPGAPKNQRWNWNTEDCEVTDDDSIIDPWTHDIEHIVPNTPSAISAYNITPFVEKWRVKETAYNYGGLEGQMAYWECRQNIYEDIDSCSTGNYWGEDVCGNPLVNSPIRHHRFPSRVLEPHVDNDNSLNTFFNLIVTVTLNDGQIWPEPGDTIDLTVNYEYDVPPPTVQTPVTVNVAEDDLVDGVYTFTVDTRPGSDTSLYSNVLFSGTLSTYTTEFTITYSVPEAYETYVNSTTLRLLGIKFTNVEYPHTDIVGHYFVRAERDDFNRTILDSGIAGRARSTNTNVFNYITFSYFTKGNNDDDGHSYLLNPKFLYQKSLIVPEYLKLEREFQFDKVNLGSKKFDGAGSMFVDVDPLIERRTQTYKGTLTTNSDKNYNKLKILSSDGLSYDDNYEIGKRIYNVSWSNKVQMIKLGQTLPNRSGNNDRHIPYVTLRVERDVHCNLNSIKYYKMHNCMLVSNSTEDDFGMYSGDVSITHYNLSNSLLREMFNGILGELVLALAIIAAAVTIVLLPVTSGLAVSSVLAAAGILIPVVLPTIIAITAITVGAIGITALVVKGFVDAFKQTELDKTVIDTELDDLFTGLLGNFIALANEHLIGVYVESEVNTALRQEESHTCGVYYNYQYPKIIDYFVERWLYYDETEKKWLYKGLCCPEIYHYNVDFSRMDKQKVYFSLPSNYECCSDCLESFPDRVYYSETSFQEELSDNYRIFLANNYRDIEAEHGGITALIRKNNALFVLTEECLWHLPQNVQQGIVNEIVTFIGTGEYFSIPPRKVVDSDLGVAGTTNKWSTIKSPLGIFFISEIEKSVYLVSGVEGGLKKISNEGMYNWFTEYCKLYLDEQFINTIGQHFPNRDNPNNPNGIGFHSVYDPRHQRVIITKRDYAIKQAYLANFQIVDSSVEAPEGLSIGLYYDNIINTFVYYNIIKFSSVFFNNETYFENKSFTISYSLLTQTWISFHSYLPLFYYFDQKTFYSSKNNVIFKHNIQGNYQKFYNVSYPHIIETVSVSNSMITRLWEDITLQTVAKKYDAALDEYFDEKDVTFNYITLYNSRQISGELQMNVKDIQANPEDYFEQQTTNDISQVVIDRKERDWHINDFRDMRSNYAVPMFTKDWSSISSVYPIDKVVNVAAINVNKNWYDQESFRDKYLIMRLRFSNFDDVELSTNFTLETEQPSIR
jgi:hypothetical protein